MFSITPSECWTVKSRSSPTLRRIARLTSRTLRTLSPSMAKMTSPGFKPASSAGLWGATPVIKGARSRRAIIKARAKRMIGSRKFMPEPANGTISRTQRGSAQALRIGWVLLQSRTNPPRGSQLME
jgi:hypothetical protein